MNTCNFNQAKKNLSDKTLKAVHEVLSESLSESVLFHTNSAIFQLFHEENQLIFDVMMIRSSLY